jgi:AcrR family transcriptional regulator
MAGDARQRMIDGAARLLAERGLQATSFAEVLAATGAPRGSIYHHFPDGKQQLVDAALDQVTARMLAVLAGLAGLPAEQVTTRFFGIWREVLTRSGLRAGCAVLAVTVAADSDALLEHVTAIFRTWRQTLAGLLVQGGMPAADAGRFAVTLIAASEGAVVLSRAERSTEPLEEVAAQLADQARRLTR